MAGAGFMAFGVMTSFDETLELFKPLGEHIRRSNHLEVAHEHVHEGPVDAVDDNT